METRKYPIPDGIKELTADALDELARRLVDDAAAMIKVGTPVGKLLAVELTERAAKLREASDYFLSL
ncbi:MAG: hypothetical protein K2O84_00130 [Oscillospiraceae bacterium]|nr:hypothetical protein [Oscillospiraceae bacterium]